MGTRPFTLVIRKPRRKWYETDYTDYYIALRAILYINKEMAQITGFNG